MRNKLLLKLDDLFCAMLNRQDTLETIMDAQREIILYNDGTDLHEIEQALNVMEETMGKLAALKYTVKYRVHALLYRIIS